MVNTASGMARGRVLSSTATSAAAASRKHGDLSYAGLVKIRPHKGSHYISNNGYSYHGLRCSLWGCLLDNGVAQDGAQRKYTDQLGSTSACSLHLCNLLWEIHFMVNWRLSKQGIRWPVSYGRISSSSVELAKVICFLELTTDQVMDFYWIAGSSIFTNY